jgi:hypothetical protein
MNFYMYFSILFPLWTGRRNCRKREGFGANITKTQKTHQVDCGLISGNVRALMQNGRPEGLSANAGHLIKYLGLRSDLECAEAVRSVDRWIRFGRLGFYVREIHQRPLDSNPRRRFVFGRIVTLALIPAVAGTINGAQTSSTSRLAPWRCRVPRGGRPDESLTADSQARKPTRDRQPNPNDIANTWVGFIP